MTDASPLPPASARRAQLGAAALVGLVVVVLGFGAGIGAVFERDEGREGSPAGASPGTTPPGGPVEAEVTPGTTPTGTGPGRTVAAAPAGRAPAAGTGPDDHHVSTPTTGDPSTTTTTTTAPAVPSVPPSTAPPAAAGCPGLVTAMVRPFWAHFGAAHLETPPGQQVADALNADDYAAAHLGLVEAILAPLVNLVFDLDGTSPLWTHLRAAHLESSPGQQVADLLHLDDYLLAHTVLVDDMLLSGGNGC